MQAFGQTEKRFAQAQGSFADLGPPGPGHYNRQIKWLPQKSAAVKHNGKRITHFRAKSASSTFKSTTSRIQNQLPPDAPPLGTYEESRIFGSVPMQGGAPNNFLKLKNERLVAPFNSTGKKGWLSFEKGKIF